MALVESLSDYSDEHGNIISGEAAATRSTVIFAARDCRIEIGKNVSLNGLKISMRADGATLRIADGVEVDSGAHYLSMHIGLNSLIAIGKDASFHGGGVICASEETTVSIGDGCLIAKDCDIRSDHSHPIYDRRTGQRVNRSRSVKIGEHVWLASRVSVMPGAVIGDGSVIGLGSVVTRAIPPHCVALGAPAKPIRRDIVWDRTHLSMTPPWRFDAIEPVVEAKPPGIFSWWPARLTFRLR